MIVSVLEAREVCLAVSGGGDSGAGLAAVLAQRLRLSGRFTFAPDCGRATACLKVSARPAGGDAAGQLVITALLVNVAGEPLWPSDGRPASYAGTAEEVAARAVADLLAAARRLERAP